MIKFWVAIVKNCTKTASGHQLCCRQALLVCLSSLPISTRNKEGILHRGHSDVCTQCPPHKHSGLSLQFVSNSQPYPKGIPCTQCPPTTQWLVPPICQQFTTLSQRHPMYSVSPHNTVACPSNLSAIHNPIPKAAHVLSVPPQHSGLSLQFVSNSQPHPKGSPTISKQTQWLVPPICQQFTTPSQRQPNHKQTECFFLKCLSKLTTSREAFFIWTFVISYPIKMLLIPVHSYY